MNALDTPPVTVTGPRRMKAAAGPLEAIRHAKENIARKAEEATARATALVAARERAARAAEAARQREEESSQSSNGSTNGSTNGYYNENGVYQSMSSWGFGGKRKATRRTKRSLKNRRRSTRRR